MILAYGLPMVMDSSFSLGIFIFQSVIMASIIVLFTWCWWGTQ
ncbi:MAG: hypothetical protein ACNS62_07485 [Candidatus Cyclobacteriaceae bacterium M3_2C_046]